MRRIVAAALTLSVLAGLFVAAPALGATYTASGSCVYTDPGSGMGMVFYYQDGTFPTRGEARDAVASMKADCATRDGRLTSSITTVAEPVTYTASGQCVYTDPGSGMGMVFYYQDGTFATQSEARAYVSTMKADCATREGRLTSSITKQ